MKSRLYLYLAGWRLIVIVVGIFMTIGGIAGGYAESVRHMAVENHEAEYDYVMEHSSEYADDEEMMEAIWGRADEQSEFLNFKIGAAGAAIGLLIYLLFRTVYLMKKGWTIDTVEGKYFTEIDRLIAKTARV